MFVELIIEISSGDTELTIEQLKLLNSELNVACSRVDSLHIGFISADFRVDGEPKSGEDLGI